LITKRTAGRFDARFTIASTAARRRRYAHHAFRDSQICAYDGRNILRRIADSEVDIAAAQAIRPNRERTLVSLTCVSNAVSSAETSFSAAQKHS
jgi:hypothetical protein